MGWCGARGVAELVYLKKRSYTTSGKAASKEVLNTYLYFCKMVKVKEKILSPLPRFEPMTALVWVYEADDKCATVRLFYSVA